ncbi:MAG: B12-binding domain-containing radical SAM protein [Steroidobacteraceae bacterium]
MLDILAAHSYFLALDPKQRERARPYPPLATLQAAALLRNRGHEVALFDTLFADPADFGARVRERRPHLLVIYEDNYNFLTKMCLAAMRHAACAMIRDARSVGARVIVGGSDATDDPLPYLESGADAVLLGEGLVALQSLAARLDASPTAPVAALVDGICGVAAAGCDRPAPSGLERPLAARPAMAAWDLVDIERYRAVWNAAHGHFSLNMAASRGCSFRCAWCAKPIWGNQYLQRPAAEVADELAYLARTFSPDHIWFADDIFGFRTDWVREFTAAARERGCRVPFTIQTRADLVSEAMADALHEAGCREAWLGAESGSQRILDAMHKGLRVADILEARARLAAAGIRVGFFIQLGYTGEQLADLLATRALIEAAHPDQVGVSVSYPLPGTRFFEQVQAELGAKSHWSDSGELAMMFGGTYTSDFYRAVRDLLHAEIDAHKHRPTAGAAPRDRVDLDRRWDTLIGRERDFRNAGAPYGRIAHG